MSVSDELATDHITIEPGADFSPAATDVPREPERPSPVAVAERVRSIDVLRGVAVLGIFAMNVVSFGWPFSGYDNPLHSGGASAANVAAWLLNTLLFSGKMMSLFAMLFGAGLVLMSDRAEARGASFTSTYYRRILWLLAFGLAHAYFLWEGDILFSYAICGLVLFFFRRKSPRTLIVLGVLMMTIGALITTGMSVLGVAAERAASAVALAKANDQTPDPAQVGLADAWSDGLRPFFRPNPGEIAKEIAAHRGSYGQVFRARAEDAAMVQLVAFPLFIFWDAAGRMLVGMGLMKLGVFSARRSANFYRWMAVLGYSAGLSLTAWGALGLMKSGFDTLGQWRSVLAITAGMLPVALGHTAVVMRLCQTGGLSGLTARLADVGRMPLTNYLTQSLIATTVFYGYGLGQFGRWERPTLWVFVLVVWCFQIAWSTWWMARFRFGPAEWLWRRLSYGRGVSAQGT
jgi:uncharacterized protein